MHYLIKNTHKFIVFVFLALAMLMALGYSSFPLNANDMDKAKKLAEKSAAEYAAKKSERLFSEGDVEGPTYSDNKDGCGMMSSMFVIMSAKYSSGASVGEAAGSNMIKPLVARIYGEIREKGIENALIDNMKGYQRCLASASRHKSPSREYDLSLKHDACGELSGLIVYTLNAIKRRQDVSRVMNRYTGKSIDFTGTSYEKLPNPELLFIAKLYKVSKVKEYKDVVHMGAFIGIACHG